MYRIVPWSESLDLTEFYNKAQSKGYINNASRSMLVDCFKNEKLKQVWILFYNDSPVGSVAAHSLDIYENNSFRIAARTCVFTDELPFDHLRTKNGILNHQNVTAQFFIPVCIEWAGKENNLYITSNNSPEGSQRLVHKIFCPLLAEKGLLKFSGEKFYRGHNQFFWKLDVEQFYRDLDRNKRWQMNIG